MTLRLEMGRDRLTWNERDAERLADAIGAETAVKLKMPALPSMVKIALKRGVRVDESVREFLDFARDERRRLADVRSKMLTSASRVDDRLFAHQDAALRFMRAANREAYLLADAPGVGKTAPAILHANAEGAERVLVICPNRAKRQWRRELYRWLGPKTPVTILHGTIDEQIAQARRPVGWVIAHWEALVHAARGLLAKPWHAVVADEAHRANNRKAQRTAALFDLDADVRLALSGHAFANSPAELFAILKFLYPALYGSYWRFSDMHLRVRPKPFGGFEVLGARRPKLLAWEMSAFTIRRTKAEVFPTLPRLLRIPVEVELTKRGRTEYEKLRKAVFAELAALDGGTKVLPIINEFVRLTRVRQYLIDPALVGAREPSVKYPAVAEWLDDLDGPPVIFSQFRQALEKLGAYLGARGHRTALIAGRMSAKESDRVQRAFLRGDYAALLVVRQAGGESLNLGRYGYVGHLDLPWHGRDLEQSEGRVDRPEEGTGKLVPTTAWAFIVADSYEEKLVVKIEDKMQDFADVFSVDHLKELFA